MAVSMVYLIALLTIKDFAISAIGGWNLVIVIQFLLSGIVLVMLGIMGEYKDVFMMKPDIVH